MKKAISILLVLIMTLSICMSLTACGGTKLTLDNYDDYLDIEPYVSCANRIEGEEVWFGAYHSGYMFVANTFYSALKGYIHAENLAPNYYYSDVKITVRFTGTAPILPRGADADAIKSSPFEFEGTFELTAGGLDKDEKVIFDLPNNYMIGSQSDTIPDEYSGPQNVKCEIISISGTAIPS